MNAIMAVKENEGDHRDHQQHKEYVHPVLLPAIDEEFLHRDKSTRSDCAIPNFSDVLKRDRRRTKARQAFD
jgi:hypothetical protein